MVELLMRYIECTCNKNKNIKINIQNLVLEGNQKCLQKHWRHCILRVRRFFKSIIRSQLCYHGKLSNINYNFMSCPEVEQSQPSNFLFIILYFTDRSYILQGTVRGLRDAYVLCYYLHGRNARIHYIYNMKQQIQFVKIKFEMSIQIQFLISGRILT